MEFNILNHFKGLEDMPTDPLKADEIGTSLFMTGNMGPKISKKMDEKAKAAGMSRRSLLRRWMPLTLPRGSDKNATLI